MQGLKSATILLLIVLPIGSCDRAGIDRDATAGAEGVSAPWFEEVAEQSGLVFTHHSGASDRHYLPEIMSGGAALFDMNNNGYLDAYLVQSGSLVNTANQPGNQLFRNDGNGSFTDITEGSGADDRGYGVGVAAGDYNNNGWVDLYVTNLGPNVLLRNNGDETFTDVTDAAGIGHTGWGSSAAFFDMDNNGDLDLFVVNYILWSVERELDCTGAGGEPDYCSPKSYNAPAPDTLYRNNGDGTFTDISVDAGLRTAFGNGLGIVTLDYNGNGLVDVFVANDLTPNQLWENQGDGTFRDVAMIAGCAIDGHGDAKAGMGVTAADLNEDGHEDVMVVNLQGESDSLYRNLGGYFVDDTARVGLGAVSRQFTRFGMGVHDFNNDGVLDFYHANGAVFRLSQRQRWSDDDAYAEPNVLFRGTAAGAAKRFEPVEPRGGTSKLLVGTSRAAVFGDINNNGRIDVLVVNRDGPVHLLRNLAREGGNWITFRVVDEHGRDAYDARVTLQIGERTIHRTVRSAYSYLAANDPRVHVGLGDVTGVSNVTITWRNGMVQKFGDFEANQIVTLRTE